MKKQKQRIIDALKTLELAAIKMGASSQFVEGVRNAISEVERVK